MKKAKQHLIQDIADVDEEAQVFKKSIRFFKKRVSYADRNFILKKIIQYVLYPLAFGILVYIIASLVLKNANLKYVNSYHQNSNDYNSQNMYDYWNKYNYDNFDDNDFNNYNNYYDEVDSNKSILYVNYVDMWEYFYWYEFDIYNILSQRYHVYISNTPKFLFYSSYGNEYKNYNCVKIFISDNEKIPNFNECNYGIGYQLVNITKNRYIQKPINVDYFKDNKTIYNISIEDNVNITAKNFCGVIEAEYSEMLKNFCAKLSKYKKVEEYKLDEYEPEHEFLEKHKFAVINSGNYRSNLIRFNQAFKAGTIPIYLGDDPFMGVYNNKSFIWIRNEIEFEEKIEYIKEIDKNESLYKEIINERIIFNENNYNEKKEKYTEFIFNIIETHLNNSNNENNNNDNNDNEEENHKGNDS